VTTTLRYPGDAQSRREQEERQRARDEYWRAERERNPPPPPRKPPRPPTSPAWWKKASPALRRGIIFAMRADGATFVEIARQLGLSTGRVAQLFDTAERLIRMKADAKFPLRSPRWEEYHPPFHVDAFGLRRGQS